MVAWYIILALILINALYVAAEFATVSVSRPQIKKMAQDGHVIAKSLFPIIDQPARLDEYIATCQIGITISSLVLGAYGQIALGPAWSGFLAQAFGAEESVALSLSSVSILAILTTLQIVFGELLPKTVALQFPTRVSIATYVPMLASLRLFTVFIYIFNGSGNFFLRLMGVPLSTHRHIHSLEEIDMLLTQSRHGGVLNADEERRLHRALRLSMLTARSIMTPRVKVFAIAADTDFIEALDLVTGSPYTRVLVFSKTIDYVIGFVNAKDVVFAAATKSDDTIESLAKPVAIVPETLRVDKLISLMRERNSHVVVVKDEYGGTLGIVSVQDILRELMGSTMDENSLESLPEVLAAGYVRLPGAFKLSRATEFLSELPEHDAETVSGLIVELLGKIPVPGETLELDCASLQVEKVARNVVVSVLVRRR
ncbi:MAG: hemolysin family protein [Candidatus Melainabacteria bacterium]|nr:hemolysin family protein [Candidatus Melainabacteria bacterium]